MYGKNIKEIREFKGISRKQLADKLGITEMSVGRYENNQREPKFEVLCKIATILNVPLSKLIECDDTKINNTEKLQRYYEQKKWEYENIDDENTIENKGLLKGLEIAMKIMNEG